MQDMQALFFDSDGMTKSEKLYHLAKLMKCVQKLRWLAGFHPDSSIRVAALETSGMKVGKGTHLAMGLVVIDAYTNNVSIGERCSIGAYVTLMSATGPDNSVLKDHPEIQGAIKTEPIVIGNDCWIGSGVIVMPGVTIGDKAVVGAGAVVTRDVGEREVVTGIPARLTRKLSLQ
jgi:maltose O-acetyltransferase